MATNESAFDPKKLYTSAVRSPEDVPQEKTAFEMPSAIGGAPAFAQPSRQDVTKMIGRYPMPPIVPKLPSATRAPVQRAVASAVPPDVKEPIQGALTAKPVAVAGEEQEPFSYMAMLNRMRANDLLPSEGPVSGTPRTLAGALVLHGETKRKGALEQAMNLARTREAGELARLGIQESRADKRLLQQRQLEREDPTAQARARLYGAQAGTAEAEADWNRKLNLLRSQAVSGKTEDERKRAIEALTMFGAGGKGGGPSTSADIYNKLVSAGMDESEARQRAGFADGGYIEGYANGGAITAPITQTQQVNPAVAQYGQYLSAAASAGVPPVPFNQYMNLLQTTRGAMQATPTQFANGGAVDDETGLTYAQPSSVDWGGVLSRGLKRLGVDDSSPTQAPAAKPTPPPTVAGGNDEVYNPWVLTPEQEAAARERGYADGGDVSALGRPLQGPGTSRSDSIPAVINGRQPAALSDGEFVIPAHVVKAKGTEFFEKLLAQYTEGVKDNG